MAAMAEATQQATGERELAARLRKVDLDLLPVLHELLRTRSVTRTAQSFNMTQPAVSRAFGSCAAPWTISSLCLPAARRTSPTGPRHWPGRSPARSPSSTCC